MSKQVTYKFDFDEAKVKNRFNKQASTAKKILKNEIVKDTNKYVPMQTGKLANSAIKSINTNSDNIVWQGPYARFLYGGHVMVGVRSHSPWAKKGETKVVTTRNLTYSASKPLACAHWFDKSKAVNIKKWMNVFKRCFK